MTFERFLNILLDAMSDKSPSWTYSDNEANLWSMIKETFETGKTLRNPYEGCEDEPWYTDNHEWHAQYYYRINKILVNCWHGNASVIDKTVAHFCATEKTISSRDLREIPDYILEIVVLAANNAV